MGDPINNMTVGKDFLDRTPLALELRQELTSGT